MVLVVERIAGVLVCGLVGSGVVHCWLCLFRSRFVIGV